MSGTRTIKLHFVRAGDPIGRMIFEGAGRMWDPHDPLPDWREHEYLRGQIETIIEVVRVIPEADDIEIDGEEQHDIAADLILGMMRGTFDDVLKVRGLS